jgi:hypothetical protein
MSQATQNDLVDLARGLIFAERERDFPTDHTLSKRVLGLAKAYAQLSVTPLPACTLKSRQQ